LILPMDGFRISLVLCSLLAMQSLLRGQDEGTAAPLGAQQSGQRVLVLVDGQLMENPFLVRPDGYDVQVAGGRLFVESSRVRFVAKSREDAYVQMRRSYPSLTPEVHMTLARWCLTNSLPDQAEREVLDALHLDPNRQDARRLLQSILQSRETDPDTPPATGVTQYPSLKLSALPQPEARSLAGLSRPLAQSYVRHIQPLLSNKCATAGCHGVNAQSEFQLTSTRTGSQPLTAERNLAAILKQVDLAHPSRSPLLSVAISTHGGMREPAFRGRSGSQQQQMLKQWVLSAAAEIAPEQNQESLESESIVRLASAESEVVDNSVGEFADAETGDSVTMDQRQREAAHGVRRRAGESDEEFRKAAWRANARDAFDPAVFNRRFHGVDAVDSAVAGEDSASETMEPERENVDVE
jgi:hypothetical protein